MIVYDNHLHLQFKGENVNAVRRFERLGGTHVNLTNVPNYGYPMKGEYYRRIYDDTIELANLVREKTKVKVVITIGPYPVDLVELMKKGMKVENARDFLLSGLELAEKYIKRGYANAIGEIGRPHFPVSDEIWRASNEIIIEGMKMAKELDVPVILHTESATEKTWKDLSVFAEKAGIKKEKVIKHYSPPVIDERNHGIFPSVIASRKNVREALKQGTRFLLETDFMDEPTRKNAVLPIESVPKRAKWIVQEYGEETWCKIMENARKIYGSELFEE